jgi:hypothetical protein
MEVYYIFLHDDSTAVNVELSSHIKKIIFTIDVPSAYLYSHSLLCYVFSSIILEIRAEQVLPGSEG